MICVAFEMETSDAAMQQDAEIYKQKTNSVALVRK
jgi:hypothetical protein